MDLLDLARSAVAELEQTKVDCSASATPRASAPSPESEAPASRRSSAPSPAEKSWSEAPATDPGTERRRARALAMLAEHPNQRRTVIVERGPPPILGVAIRDLGYGEIVLPDHYDPVLLLALIEQHGNTAH